MWYTEAGDDIESKNRVIIIDEEEEVIKLSLNEADKDKAITFEEVETLKELCGRFDGIFTPNDMLNIFTGVIQHNNKHYKK
jgi:hypothetical protein